MTKQRRLTAALIAILTIFGGLALATPASAKTPVNNSSSTILNASAATATGIAAPAASTIHPNYAAGARYYVCIEPNGSTLTVLYGQKVATQCRGAEAVSMYYESGQFIKTVRLTLTGAPGKHFVANAQDCVLAVAGTAVLVLAPTLDAAWYVSAGLTGVGLTSCISQ